MPDLESLRQEYARHNLTQRIYEIVKRAVAAVVWTRRVPSWRALDGRWNSDAITALTDDVLMEALPPAKLAYLLDICTRRSELELELERVIGDYLRETASRGRFGNLQEQLFRVLKSAPEFISFSRGGKRGDWVWGLAEWLGQMPRDGDAGQVTEVLPLLRTFERLCYRSDARKSPPALRSEDLRRFLNELFRRTKVPWVAKDIVYLVTDTLGLLNEEMSVPLEDGDAKILCSGLARSELDHAERMEIRDMALTFYKSCSTDEHAMLRALASGVETLEQVGQAAGVSKATVSRRTRALVERLRKFCDDAALAQAVWDELMLVALNTNY